MRYAFSATASIWSPTPLTLLVPTVILLAIGLDLTVVMAAMAESTAGLAADILAAVTAPVGTGRPSPPQTFPLPYVACLLLVASHF